ncbi:MAG: hypothetical protein KGI58_01945 [Patescibacteria group bacterium]|nr:hypothetical protein [Patescibacteria group bacterium]
MIEVIPAILVENFDKLREYLAHIVNITSIVQIDMCDGKFTPSISWPMGKDNQESIQSILNEESGLPFWDSIDFEFDLMVANAHKHFEFFTRLGAKRIVFHIEAENDKVEFKEFIESLDMYIRENIQIGVAINTTTPINELTPIISHIDFVQCMGIKHIGYQGQPFDERVLSQISELRTAYPELIISVDGSVNKDTAPLLVKAGANRLVVGSALISSNDPSQMIREFENL